MMLCDISVVFNSFADAFGLMSRKRSSESRQVLVSFVKAEALKQEHARREAAVKNLYRWSASRLARDAS
jgi:hypothetical protein